MKKQIEDELNRRVFAFTKARNEKAAKIQRAFRNWRNWKKITQCLQLLIKKIAHWKNIMLKYHEKRQNAIELGFQRIYRFSEEIWKKDQDQLLNRSIAIKRSKSKGMDLDQSSFYMTDMYGREEGRVGNVHSTYNIKNKQEMS